MKKLIALVLALVLSVCAVSALAADGDSKKVDDTTTAKTETTQGDNTNNNAQGGNNAAADVPQLIKADMTDIIKQIIEALKKAKESNTLAAFFGFGADSDVPADYTEINEAQAFRFLTDPTKWAGLSVTLHFPTPYPAGDTVYIMIGIPGEKVEDTEWIKLTGTANNNGDVVVVLTADILKKIGLKTFLAVALSKPSK